MAFSTQSKLGDLLDNPETAAILEKHMPGISTHPQIGIGQRFSIGRCGQFFRWFDYPGNAGSS